MPLVARLTWARDKSDSGSAPITQAPSREYTLEPELEPGVTKEYRTGQFSGPFPESITLLAFIEGRNLALKMCRKLVQGPFQDTTPLRIKEERTDDWTQDRNW
jgi:hypothetical protein